MYRHHAPPPGLRPLGPTQPWPNRLRSALKTASLGLAALLPLALPLQANATGGGSSPQGCITLKKEISINGGAQYYDANTPSGAVRGTPPKNAFYRLTVSNCGATALDQVKISDPALGLYGVKIPGSQTGRLAPGQRVVITSRSAGFGKLYVPRRCTTNGTYANVAGAEGFVVRNGVVTGTKVRDDDVAYLICQGAQPPAVSIEKQVRLPGGTFVDADTVEAAVIQTVGDNLEYRLIVSNVGTGGLTNIRVSDTDLNIQNALASNLLWSGQSVTITAVTPGFANLDAIGRCTAAGDLLNTARVTAAPKSNPSGSVSAEDPAWVKCEPAAGNPAIELKKQISFDDATWFDADDVDNALQGVAPQDAYYRFVVKNTGDERLEDLIFNDDILGLDDAGLASGITLDPGQVFVADYLPFPPFSALFVTDACDEAETLTNTAEVSASSAVDGATISDEDSAVLECFDAPRIDLQKEVSVDGGTTWLDADTDADAAATPVGSGVQYRFVIQNPGTQAIRSLVISDATLNLTNVALAGVTLQPGDSLTVTATSDPGIPALDEPGLCATAGNVTNSATVSGVSADTNTAVSDGDTAVVRCEEPVTIDFDAIPPADLPFIPSIDFPASVTEDGFTLTPGGGDLEVLNDARSFGALPGFSSPNYIQPAANPPASATLVIVRADGSTFRFVGLDGRTNGPIDGSGAPLARGNITVRGYANGSLAAQDVFDVTTGFDNGCVNPNQLGCLEDAVSAVAANLAGVAVDRLEIVLDGFDSGSQPSPILQTFVDNIKLNTDASVSPP